MMAYIVATLLRKACEFASKHGGALPRGGGAHDAVWKALMLEPADYKEDATAIFNPVTRSIMQKIRFEHGGPEYDAKYPDGIPTSLKMEDASGKVHDSGLVMYPAGHARNTTADLRDILRHKFALMARLSSDSPDGLVERFENLEKRSASEIAAINEFTLAKRGGFG